jgi:hypothetical protein
MSQEIINTGPSSHGSHFYAAFMACPEKWALLKEATDVEAGEARLVRGSLAHVGFAHLYARLGERQQGGDPDRYLHPLLAVDQAAEEWGMLGSADYQNVVAMLKAYTRNYREAFTVDAIEEELQVEFRDAQGGVVPYSARIDLRYIGADKKVWFADHKALSRIVDKDFRGYNMGLQMLGQRYLGYALYGERFGGVIINAIELGPVGSVQNAWRFVRKPLDPAPHALMRFPQTIIDLHERMQRYASRRPEDIPLYLSEHTCETRFGKCEFYERCRWGADAGSDA